MSVKSGLFGAITTVVLMLLLGNRWTFDNVPDGGPAPETIRRTVGLFSWDPDRVFRELRLETYVSLIVLIVAVLVLGGIAGRARPAAAFVGGWGAALGAAAISAMAFTLIAGEDFAFTGPDTEAVDRLFVYAGQGAGAMLPVGWLIGLAVMLGSFGAKQPQVAPTSAAPAPYPGGPTGPGSPGGPTGFPPPAASEPFGAPVPPGSAPAGPGSPAPAPPPSAPSPSAPPSAPPPGAPGTAAPAAPPASAPSPGPGGPVIGTPPDRTQVQPRPPG